MATNDPPGTSTAPLLSQHASAEGTPPRVEITMERKASLSRNDNLNQNLYKAWRDHFWTFFFWLLLSICVILVMPFSNTLDTGEALGLSIGGWFGLLACIIYFLSVPFKLLPHTTKRVAIAVLCLAILTFVSDFPVFAGIIWSMKAAGDDESKEDEDIVLGISAAVLLLHGCFAVVVFAKSMIIDSREIELQHKT